MNFSMKPSKIDTFFYIKFHCELTSYRFISLFRLQNDNEQTKNAQVPAGSET